MKTILLGLAIVLSLSGCGGFSFMSMNYPCNLFYAPSTDTSFYKCDSCFKTADEELEFMRLYLEGHKKPQPNGTSGYGMYQVFIDEYTKNTKIEEGQCAP